MTFQALRLLMLNRVLWGRNAAICVSELAAMLHATELETETLLAELSDGGWIARNRDARTVWLTARAARDLMRDDNAAVS